MHVINDFFVLFWYLSSLLCVGCTMCMRCGRIMSNVSAGDLCCVDYVLPWEDESFAYPSNLARPLSVALEASSGASDYGNKFGEPIIAGFARSFGLVGCGGERREWIKPIMFTGGIGAISDAHLTKDAPTPGRPSCLCLSWANANKFQISSNFTD